MSQIETVHARQILDSRGNPTVEVELVLRSGAHGRAAVPVGRLDRRVRGHRAARRRRRLGRQGRHARRSRNVNGEIAEAIAGADALDQAALDRALIELDGTPNKSRLGANAILGVSLAAAQRGRGRGGPAALALPRRRGRARPAGADDERPQRRRARRQLGRLPGVHGRPGRRRRASPRACAWAPRSSTRSRRRCSERGLGTAVGDEGGFAPDLESNEAALQALIEGIEAAGYTPGDDVAIALDPATSEIFEDGAYDLEHEGRTLSSRGDGRLLGRPRRPLPDPLDRGRHGRGGLGRLEGAHRPARRRASSSSATTCS